MGRANTGLVRHAKKLFALDEGDFPYEINGKWCVKYDETREDGTSATNACRASGGALLTVSSRAVAQQAMAITVRASAWVVIGGGGGQRAPCHSHNALVTALVRARGEWAC